jgi:tetratricopeptide (TPR) repeat protein
MKHLKSSFFILSLILTISIEVSAQELIWTTYMQSGMAAFQRGEYAKAEELFRAAIGETAKMSDTQRAAEMMIESLNAVAISLERQNKYEDAERVCRKTIQLLEALGKEGEPDYTVGLNNLGLILSYQKKFKEAEDTHRKALALREKNEGTSHPNVGISLMNLGKVYYDQGRTTEAEAINSRALEIFLNVPEGQRTGEQYESVAMLLNNQALIYEDQKKFTEAEKSYKLVIAFIEASKGAQHPSLINYLDNYAKLLRQRKRPAEAVRLETRARLIRSKQ